MKRSSEIGKLLLISLSLLFFTGKAKAQSLEIAVSNRDVFTDLQWLKPFDKQFRWSLFSRTRITVDYNNRANLFSGAYLNYTTQTGIGASFVGKISQTNGASADAGAHFFKTKSNWLLFGLATIGLKKNFESSWFSIFRFTPPVNESWKWYFSLELFHLFNQKGHFFSVERVRAGIDRYGWQTGLAANFQQTGKDFQSLESWGGFFRKSF